MPKLKIVKRHLSEPADLAPLSNASLACRALRHHWDWITDHVISRSRGEIRLIERDLRCKTCGAERVDTFNVPSFELITSKTKYPEGYLFKGGRAAIQDVRAEQWSRSIGSTRVKAAK